MPDPVPEDLKIDSQDFASSSLSKAIPGQHIRVLRKVLVERFEKTQRKDRRRYKALARYCYEVHIFSGARVGELLALEVGDIEVDPGRIIIERTVTRSGTVKPPKEIQLLKDPPPDYCKIAPVPPEVIESLTEWLQSREKFGFPSIEQCELVFPRPDGRHARDSVIRKHYQRACDKAELPHFTPRQLRHTYITRLRQNGCPGTLREKIVGHDPSSGSRIHAQYGSGADPEKARPYVADLWDPTHDIPEGKKLSDILSDTK